MVVLVLSAVVVGGGMNSEQFPHHDVAALAVLVVLGSLHQIFGGHLDVALVLHRINECDVILEVLLLE